MKSILCRRLLFFAVFVCPALYGEVPAVTAEQYHASVRAIDSQGGQWRSLINSVKIDDLPVNYATGKSYQDGKNIVSQDLQMLLLWGARAERSNSLFDEVNYLSAFQELQSQLQLLNNLVDDFEARDHATTDRVRNWGIALNDIANGPLNDAFKTIYIYTTQHVFQVQKACGK